MRAGGAAATMADRSRLTASLRAPARDGWSVSSAARTGTCRGRRGEGRRDGLHDDRVAAPGAADDDQPGVRERDDGGQDSADGLAEGVPRAGGLSVLAGGHAEQAAGVDGRRAGLAQPEFAEHLDQAGGLPVRADRNKVRDLAGQPGAPPADLSIADDGTAQSFPQEDVGEVIQAAGAAVLALGPRGPVHVIVDDDRAPDLRRQNLGRIQLTEQEWGVGEMDQPAAAALHRIGGAHDGEPRGRSGLTLDLRSGAQQRRGDLRGPGRPADGLPGACHRVAEGVHGLRHHTVRGDTGHERRADGPGQGVVRADPAAAAATGGPLAGVEQQPGLRQPAHALADRRLRQPRPRGQVGPGQPAGLHQRPEHVLIGQRTEQLQRGLCGRCG